MTQQQKEQISTLRASGITSVKDGATFEWIATAENGWHAIVVNAQVGWVSGKYSQVV